MALAPRRPGLTDPGPAAPPHLLRTVHPVPLSGGAYTCAPPGPRPREPLTPSVRATSRLSFSSRRSRARRACCSPGSGCPLRLRTACSCSVRSAGTGPGQAVRLPEPQPQAGPGFNAHLRRRLWTDTQCRCPSPKPQFPSWRVSCSTQSDGAAPPPAPAQASQELSAGGPESPRPPARPPHCQPQTGPLTPSGHPTDP